jgi:hypothetical protein
MVCVITTDLAKGLLVKQLVKPLSTAACLRAGVRDTSWWL